MADPPVLTRVLRNGVTVVVQEMSHLQSAAITMLLPAGSVYDQPGRSGTAALLAEMLPRGTTSLSRANCRRLWTTSASSVTFPRESAI